MRINIIDTKLNFEKMDVRVTTSIIVLHHAAMPANTTIEEIHNLHKSFGWAGVGYHFLVDCNGIIYKGRPEQCIGAHSKGIGNEKGLGICFIGNFEENSMPETQIISGKKLIKSCKEKYSIKEIKLHRELNETLCPGRYFPIEEMI